MRSQVDALLRVYDGARTADGRPLYANWAWDAGIGGRSAQGWFRGWRDWKIERHDAAANDARNITLAVGTVSAVFTSPPTRLADTPADYTRWALGLDVTGSEAAAHVKWSRFNEAAVDFMNADATHLSSFASHGGKLLVFHGVSDPVFSINDTTGAHQRRCQAGRGETRAGRLEQAIGGGATHHRCWRLDRSDPRGAAGGRGGADVPGEKRNYGDLLSCFRQLSQQDLSVNRRATR